VAIAASARRGCGGEARTGERSDGIGPFLFPFSCHRSGALEVGVAQSDKGELGSAGETSANEVDGMLEQRREALIAGPTN
jgi:hypothetical protein